MFCCPDPDAAPDQGPDPEPAPDLAPDPDPAPHFLYNEPPKLHYQNIVCSTLKFAPNGPGQPLAQIQIQIQVQIQVQIQLQMSSKMGPLNFITRISFFPR